MVAKAGGIVRSDWNYSSDGSDRQQDAAVQLLVALEDGGQLLPAIDGLMSMCISCRQQHETRGRHPRVRRRWHAARPIASVVCAVMSSKNDNVMLAIEMSYLTSGQKSVYNAFLLD